MKMGAKGLRSMVMMGLLILGLIVTGIEGEVTACKGDPCYTLCRHRRLSKSFCSRNCFCSLSPPPSPSPLPSPSGMVENSGMTPGTKIDYCNLGCASSVCDKITTGLNSGVGEGEVKEAVQHCNNACFELCNNKGASKLQLPTA